MPGACGAPDRHKPKALGGIGFLQQRDDDIITAATNADANKPTNDNDLPTALYLDPAHRTATSIRTEASRALASSESACCPASRVGPPAAPEGRDNL